MGINDDQWPFVVEDGCSINGFHPLLDYHENMGDLQQKFFYEMKLKDIELRWKEEIRWKEEEMRRMEEDNNNLTELLRLTTQERDIAQDKMQTLLNNIARQTNAVDLYAVGPMPPPIGSPPLLKPTRGGSGITESNSPSETHNNYHSIVSSPVDHFDTVTSPNMSNLVNIADHFVGVPYFGMESSLFSLPKHDNGSLIIDAIAMERPLPEKGKLLQAVQAATRATPLLETLLMTGSLPEWRNPPPPPPFPVQVPPLTVRGGATLQHDRSRGGIRVLVDSSSMCEARKGLSGSCGNTNRALGAKR